MEYYIQKNNYIISRKLTQSIFILPLTPHSYATDFLTGLLASIISPQRFSFKSLPSFLLPTVPNIC